MDWLNFIKRIRQDEEEELRSPQKNRAFAFLDDILDVGDRTKERVTKELLSVDKGGDGDYDFIDVMRDTPDVLMKESIPKTADQVREFAEDTGQSFARFGAETVMSGRELAEDTGMIKEVEGNEEWKPTEEWQKLLFGGEEDERSRSIQKRTGDYKGTLKEMGFDDTSSTGLAAIGAVGAMAMDSPITGGLKVGGKILNELGQGTAGQIAKSVDVDDIVKLLNKSKTVKKMDEATVRNYAQSLAGVSNGKEVNAFIKGIGKTPPATAKAVDDFTINAPEGTVIRDDKVLAPLQKYEGNGVIQSVNPTTNEKVFIKPTDAEYPAAKQAIDDARIENGGQAPLAGARDANGNVLHITDRTPEVMESRGFSEDPALTARAFADRAIPTTNRPNGEIQQAIEVARNAGDDAEVQRLIGTLPEADRPAMQSAMGMDSGTHIEVDPVTHKINRVPNAPQRDYTDEVIPDGPLKPTTNVKPDVKRQRGFIETAQNSESLAPETREIIAGIEPQRYIQEEQAPLLENARNLVETNESEARRIIEEGGAWTAERSATMMQLISKLSRTGRGAEAGEYAERLSNEALQAGRGNAMIAAMSRMSPEGIIVMANKTVERAAKQAKPGTVGKMLGKTEADPEAGAKALKDQVESAGKLTDGQVQASLDDLINAPEEGLSVGEKVAKNVESSVKPPKKKVVDSLVNELTKKIRQELLAPKPVGPKRTATQILQEVFGRSDEAKAAFPEAQDILREKFAGNDEVLKQIDDFLAANVDDGVINSKSTLSTAIKDVMREKQVQISKVITESWAKQAQTPQDIAQALTKEGFDRESADIISKQVVDKLTGEINAAKKKLLETLSKEVPERQRATFEDKVAKLSNIGALDDKDYLDLARTKLNVPSLTAEQSNRISELAQRMQGLPDGEEKNIIIRDIMDTIAEGIPITAREKFEAFRYTNLLSSPRTQLRNALANTFNTLVTRPATLFTGAAGDAVSSAMTGKPRERMFAELPEYYKGVYKGFFDSHEAMASAWRGEADITNPDLSDIFGATGIDQARRRQLGKGWTVVSRFMEATDKMFSGMIAGGEYAAQIERGVAPEIAQKAAHEMAEYSLLRQALDPRNASGQGDMLSAIDRASGAIIAAANKMPGGRWVVPFVRTPLNFTKQWIEFGPGGLANAALTKSMSPEKRIESLNKGLLGTGIMGIGATLVADDRVTWDVPTNPKDRDLFYAQGRKPYSVKIGEQWIPLINFGPFGLSMAIPAAVKHNFADSPDSVDNNLAQKVMAATLDMGEMLSQQTFLTGIGTLVEALQSENGDRLEKVLAGLGTQVIPLSGLQRYISTIVDPTYREMKGFGENLLGGIPGVSNGFLERTTGIEAIPGTPEGFKPQSNDLTGEPTQRNWSDYIAPYSVGIPNKDPEIQANTDRMAEFYLDIHKAGANRTKTSEEVTELLFSGDPTKQMDAIDKVEEHNTRVQEALVDYLARHPELDSDKEMLAQIIADTEKQMINLNSSSLRNRARGIQSKEEFRLLLEGQ